MGSPPAQKRVLMIDAVVWSDAYPPASPLRNVYHWYHRWLADLPELDLRGCSADADLLPRLDEGIQGVILSGSPRDAWNEDPVNQRLCDLVHACRARQIPFLGVCYGHQILGRALGGVVARQPQGLELGNTPIELTPAGRASPLFTGLPSRFDVLSSHADAVLELPADCDLFVRGRLTPIQGFADRGRCYGVQFHPETDPEVLRFLWGPRRESWRSRVSFDLDAVLNQLRPTPLAPRILRNFITHIVL